MYILESRQGVVNSQHALDHLGSDFQSRAIIANKLVDLLPIVFVAREEDMDSLTVQQILEDNVPEQQLKTVKRVLYGREIE